ncbi:Redoxin domain protein [Hymenobacter roseosalivarius DSM 11622]|uniref:Redoxin domain protein n=1 Tax=Hymenobacter roseosalivarius DSM 11622 TaxID=645990 RepID=A0A1W1URY1_9BACT|nr:TlpA disulfide reductase family protein [Hymenobacter roseosalivarius]SMB83484.1 Redoxin domain protein [Hymenobacter roseosalivarius DSM 11622]
MNRKNLLQWLPFAILALVMLTDLRPIVLGTMQRGLLATGLWKPELPTLTSATVTSTHMAAPASGVVYPHHLPLITLGGKNVDLSELKGKVVFVNLWASWCPPCIAEMPGIQALYEKVDKSKVTFVMISLDEKPAKARALLQRRGYTFPVYFPIGPLAAPFNSTAIPSTIILGPDGQVAARHDGMAEYDTPEFKTALENLYAQ